MVVVIIIGVLAATIIPQFIGTTHDAKVSAAKGDVAQLESAMERFNIHMDRYPTMDEGLKVLVEAPAGEDKKWRGPTSSCCVRTPGETHTNTGLPGFITPPASMFGRGAPMARMAARAPARISAIGS